MKTVKDAFDTFKHDLAAVYSAQEVDAITSLVMTELTGSSRAKLKAFTDTELMPEQQTRLQSILQELATGKPVQYILGHTEFYGRDFLVSPAVLIPRPETEELVDWIAKTIAGKNNQTILDMGTGSGCIPISLKLIKIDNQLLAIDISTDALEIASQNSELLNAPVTFVEADILTLQPSVITRQKYDVIVSNPPYVTNTDKMQMHYNVTDFEPHTALFVPDNDPLLFYNAIASFATTNLVNNGYLFFEINESYGSQMVDMLTEKGFTNIAIKQDMSGRDRMIRCVWP